MTITMTKTTMTMTMMTMTAMRMTMMTMTTMRMTMMRTMMTMTTTTGVWGWESGEVTAMGMRWRWCGERTTKTEICNAC